MPIETVVLCTPTASQPSKKQSALNVRVVRWT
jgi:hypothetical protein